MTAVLLLSLIAGSPQDPPVQEDVLAKYGLRPNIEFISVAGKVNFAKDETVELVGAADLAVSFVTPWDYRGKPLTTSDQAAFWRILDLNDGMRESIMEDPDKRSFALAFRIPNKNIACNDVAEDEGKNYELYLTKTVPASSTMPYIGLARVLRPKTETDVFEFRFESPGGAWKDIVKFGYRLKTEIDGIEFDMRQYRRSKFVEVEGEQSTVEYVSYLFTVKLPEELQALDLQIVTNDTAEELAALPEKEITQHLSGEVRGEAFEGLDLFVAFAPRKKEFDRIFTLQARPKRIAVFKNIPINAGS